MKKITLGVTLGLLVSLSLGLVLSSNSTVAQESSTGEVLADSSPALLRARKQAKMLDTLYKSAIVIITKNYVDGKESLAAGDAFQAIFQAMKDNGFHEVRLLDATGDPYDSDNEPKDAYEKKAIQAMLAGKTIYEEVVSEGDKTFLLSTTPIPVVMDKCVMCHSSYEGKQGAIRALGLKLLVE